MTRFGDGLSQDLNCIADQATPSPDAWDSIQTRIAQSQDQPETEIIVLDPDPQQQQGRERRWLIAGIAAALILIVGLASMVLLDGDDVIQTADDPSAVETPTTQSPEGPAPVSVAVPSTEQWTDTGIDLSIGDTMSIAAGGEISPKTGSIPFNGPDGNTDSFAVVYNVEGLKGKHNEEGLGEANHASLIGRIGEAGAPFLVGSELLSTAETQGRLFLGINDEDVENNAGEFIATITVNP